MSIKQKWDELDKQGKIIVGIGSAVAVAAVGIGTVALAVNEPDQPAQTKVTDSSKTKTKTGKDADKKDLKKDLAIGENEEDSATDGKTKKKNADEGKKETVTEKEDGTKVTVSKSIGNAPSATVKVEKSTGSTKSSSASKSSKNTTSTKNTTATESIPFETVYQNDASLESGKQVVAQNGQNGSKTITYKETYQNDQLISKVVVSEQVTKNPVNQVVRVGTKAPAPAPSTPSMPSASQAKGILSGAGVFKVNNNGTQYYYLDNGGFEAIRVIVGGNHVTSIHWYATPYKSRNVSKAELVEILGEEEGTHEYEFAQNIRRQIESAARAAANAVYGSGTAEANALYNQILNSGDRAFSF